MKKDKNEASEASEVIEASEVVETNKVIEASEVVETNKVIETNKAIGVSADVAPVVGSPVGGGLAEEDGQKIEKADEKEESPAIEVADLERFVEALKKNPDISKRLGKLLLGDVLQPKGELQSGARIAPEGRVQTPRQIDSGPLVTVNLKYDKVCNIGKREYRLEKGPNKVTAHVKEILLLSGALVAG